LSKKICKKSNIQGEKTHKLIVLKFWAEGDVIVPYMDFLMTYMPQISSVSLLNKPQQSGIKVVGHGDQLG